MERPTIICLTPVKNEAWILDKFLQCASLWADHILIADQQSTDGSREIAQKYPKVILIENSSTEFNEPERQQLLINAARAIPKPRFLIALDADEILSANILSSQEWQDILQFPASTIIHFQWINLNPDLKTFWSPSRKATWSWAFMDDDSEHHGQYIHSPRIPFSCTAPTAVAKQIKVLHFQYTDWNRMKSKQRWYMCLERIRFPDKSPIDIYRQYHHMHASSAYFETGPLNPEWFQGYLKEGIEIYKINKEEVYWFDNEVFKLFRLYGHTFFRDLAIWDKDWKGFNDPRTKFNKLLQLWLARTQQKYRNGFIRTIDFILKKLL